MLSPTDRLGSEALTTPALLSRRERRENSNNSPKSPPLPLSPSGREGSGE
jgi:hypothetical protein